MSASSSWATSASVAKRQCLASTLANASGSVRGVAPVGRATVMNAKALLVLFLLSSLRAFATVVAGLVEKSVEEWKAAAILDLF